MKIVPNLTTNLRPWSAVLAAALVLATQLHAQPTGQWDFNSGNLSATLGSDLQFSDGPGGPTDLGTTFGTTTSLGIPDINGTPAHVMRFPVASLGMGYLMPNPLNPNAGGSLVNDYTLIMDVLYPASADAQERPILDTDGGLFVVGPDLVVAASNGIGTTPSGPYFGKLATNTWYRIGFVIQQDLATVTCYSNGVRVGSDPITPGGAAAGLDGRFALPPSASSLILGSSDTNATVGYVNSIQIRDVALNAGQMQALGGPSAAGIAQVIPPVPSFIDSRVPDQNASSVTPEPAIHVVLNQGDTTVNSGSIKLYMDGALVPATVTATAPTFTIDYSVTTILRPLSVHQLSVAYSDSVAGQQTNSWSFSVASYQSVTLPAPIYTENFDEVAEGGIPAGWAVTNWTDSLTPGLNILDPQSDSYLNWVTVSTTDYLTAYPDTDDYTSPGFPEVAGNRRLMFPPIVLNGVLLTDLATGNLIVAESDQRNGNQVQVMFTSDYDFTGKTNIYVSFHNLSEQNQDNICSVEYSIDHGATWLPLLYMLDDGTTDGNGSDVVTNQSTGQIDVAATFNTARNDQAHGLAYGTYIGAAITTNLIPFIRPCRNDDPVQQKRIEVMRMAQADNQPAVRLRFMQAGTGSWFFDIDNLGFYSINTPVISVQPVSQTIDANSPVTFSVTASGSGTLSYQWEFNGQAIAGATASSYTVANVTPANAGLYDAIVSNSDGPTTSGTAQLTVVTLPQIVTQPLSQVTYVNGPVTFSPDARGGRPLSYQWYFNGSV
ncbi:MAG: immunoglobulin domain-containing protein, partial [Limisphaerales bacterium]